MKTLGLVLTLAVLGGCGGLSEPDDVEMPTFHPSIQQRLLQEVRMDPPRGEHIQYMAWSIEDHRAMTPWTSLEEADSKRRELVGQHPLLNFIVIWRQDPAPTGGTLPVRTSNN
jgi:hypothetical protein